MTEEQRNKIEDAYKDVRNDNSDTIWFTCKVEGKDLVMGSTGTSYSELLNEFRDDDRVFAFVRMTMGDELSKRAKFALITWMGPKSSVMQKAKMGTDKTKVKSIVSSFAAEIAADNLDDVSMEAVKDKLLKAGGANYGTGVRD